MFGLTTLRVGFCCCEHVWNSSIHQFSVESLLHEVRHVTSISMHWYGILSHDCHPFILFHLVSLIPVNSRVLTAPMHIIGVLASAEGLRPPYLSAYQDPPYTRQEWIPPSHLFVICFSCQSHACCVFPSLRTPTCFVVILGVEHTRAGQVYRRPAPAVHLLAQRAVEVGARAIRGDEPAGCHDSGRAGEAVGERGSPAFPRQAGHGGGAGLVPGNGAS